MRLAAARAGSSPSMPNATSFSPSTATRASANDTSGCSVPIARTYGRAAASMARAGFAPEVWSSTISGRRRFSFTRRSTTSGTRSSRTEMMTTSDSDMMGGISPVLATTPEMARAASDSCSCRPWRPMTGTLARTSRAARAVPTTPAPMMNTVGVGSAGPSATTRAFTSASDM